MYRSICMASGTGPGIAGEMVTRAGLGFPAERAALGRGKYYPLPPLLTHEPATVARWARQQ